MEMLKVGVIGLGAMGKNHARVYSELAQAELVGVVDVDYTLASNIARTYHTRPFANYYQLLKHKLDAVSIAVNTSLHKEIAINVARRGVNILVEKPIADTIEAAREIIQTAQDSKVKMMVGHIERFNPIIPVIKQEIKQTEITLIEITRIGPFPPRVKDVGVVIDLAVHDIDLIRYLTGSEFKKKYSLISKSSKRHEDTAILLFEMENGILARVTVNWLTPFKVREISIATKEKLIKASFIDQKIFEYATCKEDNSYVVREINTTFGEPLKYELEAFLDSVSNDTEPPITGFDGLRALDIALQCLGKETSITKQI